MYWSDNMDVYADLGLRCPYWLCSEGPFLCIFKVYFDTSRYDIGIKNFFIDFFYCTSHKKDIGKQYRPRSNAAERGV